MTVLSAAMALHQRYDRAQMAHGRLIVPRNWAALDHTCQQEFLDITRTVQRGGTHFNGYELPDWVKDTVGKHL